MNQEIVRPALGQAASVGDFYDAKTDKFLARSLVKEVFPHSLLSRSVIPTTVNEVGYQDDLNAKFGRLKVDCNLGASILTGSVSPGGAGRYIREKSEDPPQLQAAIYHTITTVQDSLEFNGPDLKTYVSLSSLDISEATHVLVEVQYGAQAVVVINRWLRPDEQRDTIEPQFRAGIDALVHSLQDQKPFNHQKPTDSFEQIAVYSSMLGSGDLALSGLQEAREYLELLPAEMRTRDKVEGLPIMYRLIPVKMLELFRLIQVSGKEVTTSPSSDCLKQIFDVFDAFQSCRGTLKTHESFLSRYRRYIHPNAMHSLTKAFDDLSRVKHQFEQEFSLSLKEVREGRRDPGDLWQLLRRFSEGDLAPKNLTSIAQANQEKMNFVDKAIGQGATYLGYNSPDLDQALRQHQGQIANVLFFNEVVMQDKDSWGPNQTLFMNLLQNSRGSDFNVIVDCDGTGRPLQRAVVTQYEDGRISVDDLLDEQQYQSQNCFARYAPNALEEVDIKKPLDRRFVKIACPGINCAKDKVCEWRCSICDAPLEYGFSDQYIYCDCGRALYEAYEFKCNNDRHGLGYAWYDKSDLLASLKSLDQSDYLNILILGETGVGKSTFINAFVNYLYFNSLDEALQNEELNWVIPCSFATQTMDRSTVGSPIIENKIKVGTKEDEHDGSTGQSATQKTQVYPITVGSCTYRLIDTPGIGDTRGLDFDKQNMTDILATVSGYDYLHGILILLKSNNARLTIHFSFCVKELLTHLHRDATNNVVFGFTNTRISNYMPGDTYGSLNTLLNQRPDIGLSLASNSVYNFDSESFRYLAAAKNGLIMDNKRDFDSSWAKSSEEAHRMLDYFATKEPHSVKSTTSLNGTRNLIKELTKPMAEISTLIRTNIDVTEDEVQELQNAKLTGDQLRTKLHPEKTLMRPVPLDKPRTVCSHVDCKEHIDDGTGTGNMLIEYPNPCHPVCYLQNIKPEVVADPSLLKCWAFSGEEQCSQCHHDWSLHLHFTFELETYQDTIKDLGIEQQLADHASDLELKRTAIANRKVLIDEYEAERMAIREAAAKFGLFMKENSILPYNDATVAYLDMLIEAEQAKVDAGGGKQNQNKLQSLREDKQKHNELVDILERNMQGKGSAKIISQAEVNQIINKLFGLKHFGKNLEQLQTNIAYECARTNRENPHRVKARMARRGAAGFRGVQQVSNNPIRMLVSSAPQGRQPNVLVRRRSAGKGGFSSGSMRVPQSALKPAPAAKSSWLSSIGFK